jgi:hypothetical protein
VAENSQVDTAEESLQLEPRAHLKWVAFRRFVTISLFAMWFGGFTFYASFVVPIGTDVLGSTRKQGMITRQVTQRINVLGALAAAGFVWELMAERLRRTRFSNRCGAALWLVFLISTLALFWLHPQLDRLIDVDRQAVMDHDRFYFLHRVYLWTNTIGWATVIGLMVIFVRAWTFPVAKQSR